MTARAPEPKSFFPFEFGESRAIIVGRRYERVFPVPVGEMTAKSRFCKDKNLRVAAREVAPTHLEKDRNRIRLNTRRSRVPVLLQVGRDVRRERIPRSEFFECFEVRGHV